MSRRRIIVLGGGIAGLSTAHSLARSQGQAGEVEVTLVERERRHDVHSTGRSAEILRVAVNDPITRALALETDRLFEDPVAAGLDAESLVDRTGLLVLNSGAPSWTADLERRGIVTRPDAASLRRLAPDLREAEDALRLEGRAYWFERGGRIRGERLVASLVSSAQRAGVTLLRNAGDAEVVSERGAVRGVRLHDGRLLDAEDVVVAAGAWSGPMARGLGVDLPLRTTRRHMFMTSPDPGSAPDSSSDSGSDSDSDSGRGNTAPVVWDDDAAFYIRREGSRWGISICDVLEASTQAPLYPVDPEIERMATEAVAGWVRRPGAALPLERGWSGFRDLSPDDRPILGPDPRLGGLHWCCGLGGHGMTLSLGLGRAAASAILGQPTELAAQCTVGRFESVLA